MDERLEEAVRGRRRRVVSMAGVIHHFLNSRGGLFEGELAQLNNAEEIAESIEADAGDHGVHEEAPVFIHTLPPGGEAAHELLVADVMDSFRQECGENGEARRHPNAPWTRERQDGGGEPGGATDGRTRAVKAGARGVSASSRRVRRAA